jgi:hypothetical protein
MKDIRDWLSGSPLNLTNVFVADLTATPVNQYAVMEYAGHPSVKTHRQDITSGVALDQCRIQIMHRNANPNTAHTNIYAVADALDGLKNTTINTVVYAYISICRRPWILDRDETGAVVYAVEFDVTAKRA